MTGAPKLRTLEIIDRTEGHPRGVYSGALGFFAVHGTADLNVVIRTLVASPERLRVGAGGPIVAASDPEAELEEMLLKARSVLAAVGGQPPASKIRISPRRSSRPSPLQRA
jgi:para-aminobenzoate synthetase